MRSPAWTLVLALACSSGPPATTATPPVSAADPDPGGPASYACDPSVGLVSPVAACTQAAPCTTLLPTLRGRDAIADPSDVPTCTAPAARGGFADGPARSRVDADGVTRYACVFVPPGAGPGAQVPLVLFFHGAGGSADNVYGMTSLRRKAASYPLSDAAGAGPGFVLVSIQGRNLHWPTRDPRDAPHHDAYHRDLGSPSTNPDIANADAWVDAMVASGSVDPARVYAVGWSNGAFFAELYAIARFETATAGGNHVAAAAVYDGADPFRSPRASDRARCDTSPPPRTRVPIAIVSRACDIVACDSAQAVSLGAEAAHAMQPGTAVRPWVERARQDLHDPNVAWRIVDAFGHETTTCTIAAMCPFSAALIDHVRWPDGVADESGIDHEPFLLDFLRSHTGLADPESR